MAQRDCGVIRTAPSNYRAFVFIGVIIGLLMLFPAHSTGVIAKITMFAIDKLGLAFILFSSLMLIISCIICVSKIGEIKLGGEQARTEFSTFSWLAMLFTAGMGSGLIFWGVAEPAVHYANLPSFASHYEDKLNTALSLTYFHWGFHAWSIYALAGLAVAWFGFNRGRGLTISASFGKHEQKSRFKLLDWLAIISIIFGVAGTFANSIALAETGLQHIFSEEVGSFGLRISLIIIIAGMFVSSSLLGLKKGIKRLSLFNTFLMLAMLLVVLVGLDPLNMLNTTVSSFIAYLKLMPSVSFSIEPASKQWSLDWSVIYIIWWVAWAPFVGTFIARISKGRTVRQFLIGAVCIPTLASVVWFSAFGGEALSQPMANEIVAAVNKDYTLGLFTFFEQLPFSQFLSLTAIILLLTFIVTSADSAIIVCCMLSGNEAEKTKIYWSILLVILSVSLIYTNDVNLNKQVAIAGAIPFTLVVLVQVFIMLKDMFYHNKKVKSEY